jgi:uncharacterized repeat protein (TIGR01451 family)
VTAQSTVDYNAIFDGAYSVVQDFGYPARVELAGAADTEAEVLGTSGGADLLLNYPGFETEDTGQVRSFTQNVRVLPSDAVGSQEALKGLFENVVAWLLRGPVCRDVDVIMDVSGPGGPVLGDPAFEYTLVVSHNGECEATGAVVTDTLPPGVRFMRAESEQGTWSYDSALNEVTFRLGHLAKASRTEMRVTVVPLQGGTLTNCVGVRINGPEVRHENNSACAVTVVQGGITPTPPRLSFQVTQGALQLHLSGQPGVSYLIQSSPDLRTWATQTNFVGPEWGTSLAIPTGSTTSAQFYRARVTP